MDLLLLYDDDGLARGGHVLRSDLFHFGPERLFHFLKAGPYRGGNTAARELDGEDWSSAADEGNEPGPQAVIIV
jgi:hypothetical protein